MRLIDLDELLKFPIRLEKYDKKNGNKHFVLGIESVLEFAENLPTVDAVEVVRCKDCKEYKYCFLLPNDDDYCSYGEREER